MESDSILLQKLLPKLNGLKAARLTATETPYTNRADALSAFLAYPGDGWLCTSEAKAVYDLREHTPDHGEYPLHGERVHGSQSLHLRQDGEGGWTLTTLEEVPDEGSVCFETQLAAHDAKLGSLRYQVCHALVDPMLSNGLPELSELRPQRARFLGFGHISKR